MSRTLVAVALALTVGIGVPRASADNPPLATMTSGEVIYDVDGTVRPAHIARFDECCADLCDRDPFSKWQGTFQAMVGYFPKTSLGPGGPNFDYVPLALRFGCIWTEVRCDHSLMRGFGEVLLEVNYCPVLREFGTYVTGPNLIARYNFVQPHWAVIPYIQGGAGLAYTDAGRAPDQELIGQEWEFLLRAELGARIMLTECLSLDAEAGFQHISNAAIASRNGGVNNVGFALGMTYFFGKLR